MSVRAVSVVAKSQLSLGHSAQRKHACCAAACKLSLVALAACACVGEASIHGGGVGGFRLVEAKYPALLFKQQLDAFVQKIFPMMRDNVKKNITPMLVSICRHT